MVGVKDGHERFEPIYTPRRKTLSSLLTLIPTMSGLRQQRTSSTTETVLQPRCDGRAMMRPLVFIELFLRSLTFSSTVTRCPSLPRRAAKQVPPAPAPMITTCFFPVASTLLTETELAMAAAAAGGGAEEFPAFEQAGSVE